MQRPSSRDEQLYRFAAERASILAEIGTAVAHLYEMLRRFKQEYYAAYHGDLAAIGRHAVIGDE